MKKDVCSNKQACKLNEQYKQQRKLHSKTGFNVTTKQCSCSGRLKYRCAKNYCTLDKHSCSKVEENALNDSVTMKQIDRC